MLVYFAVTLFVSAFLLFLVQPMVGKMILPRLGGTPAVWNTCMVFFQAVLLIGYGYTHSLTTYCTRRRQLMVQMAILILPIVFLLLPFSLGNWQPPDADNPIFSVLWLLLGMVGLPFFVVATSAPLLQKWFADTGHQAGKDPYFLYGASNLGSMLALVLYPVVVEPALGVDQQAWVWTIGYVLLAGLMGGCMVLLWQTQTAAQVEGVAQADSPAPTPTATATAVQPARKRQRQRGTWPQPRTNAPVAVGTRPVTLARRLRWLGLSAAASSLMLGVTTHLTTDIAAIPFFWVIPLGLYLLTFILVFSRWPVVWTETPHTVALYMQPILVACLVFILVTGQFKSAAMTFTAHLVVFFVTTLVCHGELAKDRPATRHLTEFYLWMSLGGVVGGIFNALIAPQVFWFYVVEYPLALIVAYMLRPTMIHKFVLVPGDSNEFEPTVLGRALDFVVPILIAFWAWGVFYTASEVRAFRLWKTLDLGFTKLDWSWAELAKVLAAVAVMCMYARPVRFGLSLALFALVAGAFDRDSHNLVFEDRSFFGFVRVRLNHDSEDNEYYSLIHGFIDHGWQAQDPKYRRQPISYFHPHGGIGQVFQKFSWYGTKGKPFAWPDARLPASMVGLGFSPLDPSGLGILVNTQSEPAFGVIGLGIGTLGAHAKPYQYVRFYEIDPLVKRLSLPPSRKRADILFHFLQDAEDRGSDIDVILGDGRLQLERHKNVDRYYHIFVIDAFASDAIPVHLLTKEALQVYLSKLVDGGILVFNTTNSYVDLNGVLMDLADELDLTCHLYSENNPDRIELLSRSDWVVMQRKNIKPSGRVFNGDIVPMPQRLLPSQEWKEPPRLGRPAWTDRYSNLLGVMTW